METEKGKIVLAHRGGKDSLRDKLDECERKYIKRYNKLMVDYNDEENRSLGNLKVELVKEFGMDLWDQVLDSCDEADTIQFYRIYSKLSKLIEENDKQDKKLELA